MSNEKRINKAKSQLIEALAERVRRKVLYDSQMIILEGQRKVVMELENRANHLQDEYRKAHEEVDKLITELNTLTGEMANELDNNLQNEREKN